MAFSEALRLYGDRKYSESLASCRNEAARSRTHPRDPLYQRLLDEICMHSAACGQVIGFDGRLLQVLPANPDTAWLGVQQPQREPVNDAAGPVQEFSSIQDALQEAQDGDVIQLLPGTHVTSQSVLTITKRVMITAAKGSSNQHVILDHRANHPAFAITRSCILRGFTIDMVGFCEVLNINGASTTVKPILQDLVLCCSGDDGIAVSGKAQPLIRSCDLRVRHTGLKQNEAASTTLWQTVIAAGKHALVAAGDSQTFLEGCKLQDCGQDGIIGMQKARVNLTETQVSRCGGPAIDMSDESSVVLKQVDIVSCQGGIWLWHKSSCEAICSHITGGDTYAVLLDSEAYARGSSCTIDGPCHVTNMPGESEPDSSDGASEDSGMSSASPVCSPGPAAHKAGRAPQPVSREAFKAAAASRAAAGAGGAAAAAAACMAGAGILPGAAAAANLGVFGPSSPFGSSNGSVAGSAYEIELPMADEDLVHGSMCVADKVQAAALFPAEQGAFGRPQPMQFGRF